MLGLAFRPDGKQACACAIDGTLKFWDLVTEAAHPPRRSPHSDGAPLCHGSIGTPGANKCRVCVGAGDADAHNRGPVRCAGRPRGQGCPDGQEQRRHTPLHHRRVQVCIKRPSSGHRWHGHMEGGGRSRDCGCELTSGGNGVQCGRAVSDCRRQQQVVLPVRRRLPRPAPGQTRTLLTRPVGSQLGGALPHPYAAAPPIADSLPHGPRRRGSRFVGTRRSTASATCSTAGTLERPGLGT